MKLTKIRKKITRAVGDKFLLRTLKTSFNQDVLKRARVKGLYFKKFIDPPLNDHKSKYLAKQVRKCIQKKMFNYLTQVSLTSFRGFRFLGDFSKDIRSLKRFRLEEEFDWIADENNFKGMNFVLKHTKLLPKNIESITMEGLDLGAKKMHLRKLYRTFTMFRKLKSIKRDIAFETSYPQVGMEYPYINRYLPRLPNLKEFKYSDPFWIHRKGFQRVLEEGLSCPWITHLIFELNVQTLAWNYEYIDEVFEIENSEDNDSTDPGNGSESDSQISSDNSGNLPEWIQERQNQLKDLTSFDDLSYSSDLQFIPSKTKSKIVANQVMAMFQFHLFPNLRSLTLSTWNDPGFVVGSYVADAFASLKNLKCLRMDFVGRLKGTRFFFDGLLKLPMLDAFSLRIPFIRDQEWSIFSEFLNKQTNLGLLMFSICKQRSMKDGYIEQNNHIKSMLSCLQNLPKLEYLALDLDFFSVETLSKALGDLTAVTQLRALEIEGLVLPPVLTGTTSSLVGGLSKFLKMQKKLSKLKINFPFLLEEIIMKDILQTVSKLSSLKRLTILINSCQESTTKYYITSYEEVFKAQYPIEVTNPYRPWQMEAVKTLRNLNNLEYIKMHVDTVGDMSSKEQKGLVDIFKSLQNLKTLRKFAFKLPFDKLSSNFCIEIKRALSELNNGIFVKPRTSPRVPTRRTEREEGKAIDRIIKRINKRQRQRIDLMF